MNSLSRWRFRKSFLRANSGSGKNDCSGAIDRDASATSGCRGEAGRISGTLGIARSIEGESGDDALWMGTVAVVAPAVGTGALNFRCQSMRPLSSVRWTASTIASRILAGSRKRTSRFAGWTFTSTSCGSRSTNRNVTGNWPRIKAV